MSDKMIPIAFEQMLKGLLEEYKKSKRFLSVPVKRNTDPNYTSAIGPAAGPHTQLAGNIIAGYGAGASHFELKTVQIMEGEALGIVKPCIYSWQEVYNTEWSTELTVNQAAEEYIKAYILLKILIKEFQLGNENGFHFIMSVGYNLAGILSKKIDDFIENMKNASETSEWKKDISYLLENIGLFEHVTEDYIESLSPSITNTIALSTMHGCRSEEIQSIAQYLIEEKELNTYIKLNPTLLGKEQIQTILDGMGYTHITYENKSFEMDINFSDAVEMIQYLQGIAKQKGKAFGVKLTNTFQVNITKSELAGETMYLSGAALYPISIAVAAKLEEEFKGTLPISYSGGADVNNIKDILNTGIYPVTVSSILLKTGGYKNITKMNEQADREGFVKKEILDVEALNALAIKAVSQSEYFSKERKSFAKSTDYSILCAKCNNCVDVCPNRANKKVMLENKPVVIHYDSLCNECGNCSFACIAGHIPYLEKLTVFNDRESFDSSENEGFLVEEQNTLDRMKNDEVKDKIKHLEEYYEF
ncbi:MAG: 4Fe-4S dicluster domain-containing protein [Lachnotalea sp.]